jgi:hypothetical protein
MVSEKSCSEEEARSQIHNQLIADLSDLQGDLSRSITTGRNRRTYFKETIVLFGFRSHESNNNVGIWLQVMQTMWYQHTGHVEQVSINIVSV